MSELKWGSMHSHDYYKTLHRGAYVAGWIVLLDKRWVARTADGSIRADFDTMDEAQQFLTVVVSAGENNG